MQELIRKTYKLLWYPNRIQRIKAHWRTHRRHQNAVRNFEEQRRLLGVVRTYPTTLFLDPFPGCNLRCPFCPTTNGWAELDAEMLSRESFDIIVSKLRVDLLCRVNLFRWGEPFLNRDIFHFIRHFASHGITTNINSNLSSRDFDVRFCREIVESGLTELYVSVDGASSDSYKKYRVGGNFDRVLNNMRTIAKAKRESGSATPGIYYKMLLHRHNEHEIEAARRLARDCGAELLLRENFWSPEELREEWKARSVQEAYGEMPVTSVDMRAERPIHTECSQMWDAVNVNANGDVYPCCVLSKPRWRVGNLLEESFEDIWNNGKMRALRRYVTRIDEPSPDFDNFCSECENRFCVHKSKAQACAKP